MGWCLCAGFCGCSLTSLHLDLEADAALPEAVARGIWYNNGQGCGNVATLNLIDGIYLFSSEQNARSAQYPFSLAKAKLVARNACSMRKYCRSQSDVSKGDRQETTPILPFKPGAYLARKVLKTCIVTTSSFSSASPHPPTHPHDPSSSPSSPTHPNPPHSHRHHSPPLHQH